MTPPSQTRTPPQAQKARSPRQAQRPTRRSPNALGPDALAARKADRDRAARPVPEDRGDHHLDALRGVLRDLTDLLLEENGALERHDLDRVRGLATRKEHLARLYREQMDAISSNPVLIDRLPDAERDGLAADAGRLNEAMAQNGILLRARMDASNRVVQFVVEAVKRHRSGNATYSAKGRLDGVGAPRGAMSLAFNQEL